MAVAYSDLKLRGSAVMPDDNVETNIGGAIDLTKKASFTRVAGLVELITDSPAASGQTVTLHYRTPGLDILTEAKQTAGGGLGSPIPYDAIDIERILKAVMTGPSASGMNIAVRSQTPVRQDTLDPTGTTEYVVLDAGASAVDGAYEGMVLTIDSGALSGTVVEGVKYVGASKRLYVGDLLAAAASGAYDYTLAEGVLFDGRVGPVTEVREVFYDAQADAVGGSTRLFHDKVFFYNASPTEVLAAAEVVEALDTPDVVTFGIAASKDDAGGNGVGNSRLVAPTGITFDGLDKAVPSGELGAEEGIGVWLRRTAAVGAPTLEAVYGLGLNGEPA